MSITSHFVYILYSAEIDRYYIGSCSGAVEDRLKKHLTNHGGYTGRAKDWAIVYSEAFDTVSDARKRELQIKKWKSRKMIERLISGD